MSDRIANAAMRKKVMSAEDAAGLINNGDNVGFSGFTGSGYPKMVPDALAERARRQHADGQEFRVGSWTGASTAPELDGALAEAEAVSLRLPYQSDPSTRNAINAGSMDYTDIHLSHVAPLVLQGFLGNLDVAVVEVSSVKEDGRIVPSSSVGNNKVYLDQADKVILEVNSWQSLDLEGMHDIYQGTALPPHRTPIPLTSPSDRIGEKYYSIDPEKIVAIVETDQPDRNTPFKPLDDQSKNIAGNLLDFYQHEIDRGRIPKEMLPMQSGVGNIANAVLAGLEDRPWENLMAFTEVIQDGMVGLIDSGKVTTASATAFSLSPEAAERMNDDAKRYRNHIIMRQQDVSNHPELIRRLGVLATNGLIEADIYGNVNSTHVMGSRMQNGIGGSGDFTRNAYIAAFVTPATAKGGNISCIVPFVSHVDHTEHDVDVIVTEYGLADLRGLAPRKRAKVIIENCAAPEFKPLLQEYFERSQKVANGQHTPHDLELSHEWHRRMLKNGTMLPQS